MEPAFVHIGENYFAIIKAGRSEEILEEKGRNKPFPSATAALRAAQNEIAIRLVIDEEPEPAMSQDEPGRDEIAAWKSAKAAEVQHSRDLFALRNVQVVHRKRRRA